MDEIREKRLRPGDRVMSERELAQKFGVSTMTSKGALARLAAQGHIVRARGKGSFVAQRAISQDETQALAMAPALTRDWGPEEKGASLEEEAAPQIKDRIIALIVPGFADSFGAKIVRAVEEACGRFGMHLLLRITKGLRSREDQAIDDCLRLGVSGILVMPVHGEHYNTKILRLVLDGFPVVLLDRYFRGIPTRTVFTDNVLAARDLTELLFVNGHRHIAFLSPPTETSSISDRLQGFQEAHSRNGVLALPERVYTGVRATMPIYETDDRDRLIAIEAQNLKRFVDAQQQVTAYVACEYEIALLARRVLSESGNRVPEDVSLVCFDNYHGVMDEVFFTHVRQDEEAMGRCGVELVVQALQGNAAAANIKVPHEIILSKSISAKSDISI